MTTVRRKSQERLELMRREASEAMKEHHLAKQAEDAKTARLRALRLAKEAADQEAAAAASKQAATKKPARRRVAKAAS